MRIAGLVLAGGLGRRMGGADKALVLLAGKPLIAHVLARLQPQVAALAISANGEPARFSDFAVPVLPDPVLPDPVLPDPVLPDPALPDPLPDFPGPLAGLLAGLTWAKAAGYDAVATVAVDTPFFPVELVAQLARAIGSADVAMAQSGGRLHPTCALWRVGVQAALVGALAGGQRRVAQFAQAQAMVTVPFASTTPDRFFNINDAGDLVLAETLIRGGT